MKKPYIIILLCSSIVAGIFIGRTIFKVKPRPQVSEVSVGGPQNPYPHLNPLIKIADNISMRELRLFKDKIEKYLHSVKSVNKDLFVSYYFRDLVNGLWIGINEKERFSPASLMKTPIMIATLKEAENNPSLLSTSLLYNKKDFEGVMEEAGFAKEDGKYYSVEELIRQMIIYSDNAAALLLMNYIGEDKVVKVEADLNLDVPEGANTNTNFIMVKSYASIFRVLYNGSYLSGEMSEKALSILSSATYKNGIRRAIPDSISIAHKYGERDHVEDDGKTTSLQLHHFGIVYYPRKPFLVGIMTRGKATKEVKEKIIYDLVAITYQELDRQMKQDLSSREQSIIQGQ